MNGRTEYVVWYRQQREKRNWKSVFAPQSKSTFGKYYSQFYSVIFLPKSSRLGISASSSVSGDGRVEVSMGYK